MPRRFKKFMDLSFDFRIDHNLGAHTIWTGKAWRGAKQAADQRPFCIDLASSLAQVRATEIGKGRRMRLFALNGEPGHFIGRGGYRPAAVVTAGLAGKGGNALPKKFYFLLVVGHGLREKIRVIGRCLIRAVYTLRSLHFNVIRCPRAQCEACLDWFRTHLRE